jgi:hypothetical protein
MLEVGIRSLEYHLSPTNICTKLESVGTYETRFKRVSYQEEHVPKRNLHLNYLSSRKIRLRKDSSTAESPKKSSKKSVYKRICTICPLKYLSQEESVPIRI